MASPFRDRFSLTKDSIKCVLLILSGTLIAFFVDGFITSVGMLKAYWEEDGVGSRATLDWILSSMLGGCYLLSPLVNFIASKIGFQLTIMMGGYLAGLSILGASFCTEFWGLWVTLGLLTTLSFAMQYIASIICISMNFEEKRPTAMGILTCGTGIGVTAYSVLTPFLRDLTGNWQVTLIFLACINIQAVILGGLMRSREKMIEPETAKNVILSQIDFHQHQDVDNTAENTQRSSANTNTLAAIMKSSVRIPGMIMGSGAVTSTESMERVDLNIATVTDLLKLDNQPSNLDINQMIGALGSMIYINKVEEYMPTITRRVKGEVPGASLFRNPLYMLTLAGSLSFALANQTPNLYLLFKMTDLGYTDKDVGHVNVVYGLFNSLCRVLVGLFATSKYCNVIYLVTATSFTMAVFTLVVPWMRLMGHFYIYALGFGFGQASCTVLFPLIVAKVVPVKDLTGALSKQLFTMGCGFLIGAPIGGFVYARTDSYEVLYAYCASLLLLGSGFFALASAKNYASEGQKRLAKALKAQVCEIDTSNV